MNTKINYKAFIPYFICITTYICCNREYPGSRTSFGLQGDSRWSFDKVYHYDILGYVIGGLTLFIFSNYFNLQKIIIFNLLIYALSIYNVGFSTFSELFQKIYPMIYSATNLVIITSLLYYIFNDKK